jgi:hypothetical protein
MSNPYISTPVRVVRIGSETIESASGTTTILWNLNTYLNNNLDGFEMKIEIPEQELVLNLGRFNDDTDQDEEFQETIKVTKIKIEAGRQEYSDFIKNLQNGLKPKELELWRDQLTLSF